MYLLSRGLHTLQSSRRIAGFQAPFLNSKYGLYIRPVFSAPPWEPFLELNAAFRQLKCTFPANWKKSAATVSLIWDSMQDSRVQGKYIVHVVGKVVQKIQFIAYFIYYRYIIWDVYDNTIYIAVL